MQLFLIDHLHRRPRCPPHAHFWWVFMFMMHLMETNVFAWVSFVVVEADFTNPTLVII